MAVHSIGSMLPASRDLHRRGKRGQLQVYVPCAGAAVQLLGDRYVMVVSYSISSHVWRSMPQSYEKTAFGPCKTT